MILNKYIYLTSFYKILLFLMYLCTNYANFSNYMWQKFLIPYVHMLRHDLLMLIDYLVVIALLMSKSERLTDYEELR